MLSYDLSQKTVIKLQDLQIKIIKMAEFIDSLNEQEHKAIKRYAFISNIGASTRIENAVLTNNEIDWLDQTLTQDGRPSAFESYRSIIQEKISKDKTRSIEEVAGCRDFLKILYLNARDFMPFSEVDLRQLHHELLKFYSKAQHYLGQYKNSPNSVVSINHQTGEKIDVLRTADPGNATKMAMQNLFDWYRNIIEEHAWPVAVACEFIFRFLAIHPFQDGNGRLSRGLFHLALMQSPNQVIAKLVPFLSTDRSIEENRQEYYIVLRQCSDGRFRENPKEYKMEYLLNFMIKMMSEALDDIPLYHQKHLAHEALNTSSKKILECFKEQPEVRLKTSQLIQSLQLPRRTLTYRLRQLTKKGFLQRSGDGAGTEYHLMF